MIGAVILASQPFRPPDNGHQMELISPIYLLESALKPFFQAHLEHIVLVLGHDYHRILNGIKGLPSHLKVVIHRKPERGLGSALSVGLKALDRESKGIVIARGDQVIETRVLEILIHTFEEEENKTQGRKRIVVPLYHGKRGLPWVVSSELRKSLLSLEGDFTLSSFLKDYRKEVLTIGVESQQIERDNS